MGNAELGMRNLYSTFPIPTSAFKKGCSARIELVSSAFTGPHANLYTTNTMDFQLKVLSLYEVKLANFA